jgi:hypothetical protein
MAGGAIAIAGPELDPRGALEMINSGALEGLGFAIGLMRVPAPLQAANAEGAAAGSLIARSTGWLAAALGASLFFIGILGRGIPWRL